MLLQISNQLFGTIISKKVNGTMNLGLFKTTQEGIGVGSAGNRGRHDPTEHARTKCSYINSD